LTVRDKRNIHIATVGHVDAATKDEAEANVCLLAASPELLKVCKEAVATAKSTGMLPSVYKEWEQTIEKAEGKCT